MLSLSGSKLQVSVEGDVCVRGTGQEGGLVNGKRSKRDKKRSWRLWSKRQSPSHMLERGKNDGRHMPKWEAGRCSGGDNRGNNQKGCTIFLAE